MERLVKFLEADVWPCEMPGREEGPSSGRVFSVRKKVGLWWEVLRFFGFPS